MKGTKNLHIQMAVDSGASTNFLREEFNQWNGTLENYAAPVKRTIGIVWRRVDCAGSAS